MREVRSYSCTVPCLSRRGSRSLPKALGSASRLERAKKVLKSGQLNLPERSGARAPIRFASTCDMGYAGQSVQIEQADLTPLLIRTALAPNASGLIMVPADRFLALNQSGIP